MTDQIFDKLPSFQAQAEMLQEPHATAGVTPNVVAAFAAAAAVFAQIAGKQKAMLDAALEADYEVPAEAVRAAAAARRCMWSMPMEDHPDSEDCFLCLKAAKLALDATAPHMVAPLQAQLATQEKAIAAVLEITASIGRSLSRQDGEVVEADYALFGLANRITETVTTIIEGTS